MKEMYAIEINNLKKSFKGMYALNGLNMRVPVGSIYGFIGENGSGKSTTEKLVCGLLVKDSGDIKLFGKDYTDPSVRVRVGALIENAGCFPSSSIYMNLKMQALNLGIKDIDGEIDRVLKIVRMSEHKNLKFKKCSLGMKQRVGIALSLLNNPLLLILDEPINGLDSDGMRIMREILVDITKNLGTTVLISSHVLGELEKIATHYGIIKRGKMIKEIDASLMDDRFKTYIIINTNDNIKALELLASRYKDVRIDGDLIYAYDIANKEELLKYLFDNDILISYVKDNKVGLEEYYVELMREDNNE